jgi:hypothetical protein
MTSLMVRVKYAIGGGGVEIVKIYPQVFTISIPPIAYLTLAITLVISLHYLL